MPPLSEEDDELVPRNNPDLIGHEKAEREFVKAFNAGRLHHAWLITGPAGIGKATLAYRMARFVLSQPAADDGPGLFGDDLPANDPESLYVSPETPVFKRITAGGHTDFRAIERGSDEKTGKRRAEILVGEVRGIGEFMSLTPGEGGWRVVLIDSADELNTNAANAVLKVLEEPPKNALMLLVCHNPGRLLPTIRSRCRRLALNPLSEAEVAGLLETHLPELPPEERMHLAHLSEGSLGRALRFAEDSALEISGEMTKLFNDLPRLDIPTVHRLGDKIARDNSGEAFAVATEIMSQWLTRTIKSDAIQQGPTPALEQWIEVWEKTSRLFRQTDGINLDKKQVIVHAFQSIGDAARP
ncbi:MAG: DNA polymerase III subunit delta' [Rhodospirillaceae bacterium]|jgi:DNA polymerase-3 subunit delta'